MKESTMFEYLTKTEKIRQNSPETIKESKDKIDKSNVHANFYDWATDIIYDRLTREDDFKWQISDYQKFKTIFSRVDVEKTTILADSILKCLVTPNKLIMEQLTSFSNIIDWYPEGDRIKDETGKYIYKIREIELVDCFKVCIKLMNKMYQFIHNYYKNITTKVKNPDDLLELIEKFKNDYVYQQLFLYNFEQEFAYLKSFTLFEDIYDNMKEQLLKNLIFKLRTHFNFEELEYDFGKKNMSHRNALSILERRKEKKAIYDKKRRNGY